MPKEYIEREALFRTIENIPDNELLGNDNTTFVELSIVLDIISEQPTADVQKVRHAKWVEQLDGTHYCSYCGRDATYTFDGNEVCGIKCTYCGTTMDKE